MADQSDLDRDRQRDIAVARIDFNVAALKEELIGGPGREGRIPKIEKTLHDHGIHDDTRFGKLDTNLGDIRSQLSYWKGALALIALLVAAFGGVLLEHVIATGK